MPVQLNGETVLYPIVGDPVAFLKSPSLLTAELAARGHNGACVPMQAPEGKLQDFLRGVEACGNVRGLLVTMPHKHAMFAHCATSSPTAKLLRAVSIVRRNADGSWHGEMLDGESFVAAQKKQGASLEGARVLQVGAGGAGGAIALALLNAGVRELVLHDPDAVRLNEVVELLNGLGRGHVVAGSSDPTGCSVVVNATPLGMSHEDALPVAAHLLHASMFVGDVVAGHGVTPLLQAAQAAGCRTANGVQMVEAGIGLMADFLLG